MTTAADIRRALQCGNPNCACHKGPNVHCVAHEDEHASLTVNQASDGKILVQCKAGCSQVAVITALKAKGLWATPTPHADKPVQAHMVACYGYKAPTGTLVAEKARFEHATGKYFRWRIPGRDTWNGLDGMPMSDLPLFGAELVADAPMDEPVYYVEGEKAALMARSYGLLAVTHGGGASTKEFGNSLEVLRNRSVVLWPDNDQAGAAYMARVQAALQGVAATVATVTPPVPEKGDAVEFFTAGGKAADLLAKYRVADKPDFYRRGMGYTYEPAGSSFRFNVDYMVRASDDMRATVVAERRNSSGNWERVHRGKMLMEGGNSKRDFAKSCQEMADDETQGKYWRSLVEDVSCRVLDSEEEGEPVVMVGQLPEEKQYLPIVEKLLPTFKPTVLYGPGGVGKGYIATGIAVAVQTGKPFLGLEVQRCNVLYLDWEDDETEFDLRIKEVCAGLGMERPVQIARRGCAGSPLRAQVAFLSKYISEHKIGLVIIDSVEAATGAAPDGASFHSVTASFYEALHKLGRLTFLLIDHVNAAGRANKTSSNKIFGSIFKENWARSTWEARSDQKPGERSTHVALYHRKVNRGMLQEPIGIELDFSVDRMVVLRSKDVTESKELSGSLSGPDRIMAALHENDGPMSASEIEDELSDTSAKVRTWLKRLKDRAKIIKSVDGRWELASKDGTDVSGEVPW